MLDRASIRVDFAHHMVMPWADKQRSPALEIAGTVAWPRQDQSIDAARVLMQPMEQIPLRARRNIEVKHSEQAPVTIALCNCAQLAKLFCKISRLPQFGLRDLRISSEDAIGRRFQILRL